MAFSILLSSCASDTPSNVMKSEQAMDMQKRYQLIYAKYKKEEGSRDFSEKVFNGLEDKTLLGYGAYEPSKRKHLTSPAKRVVWVVYPYVNEFGSAIETHDVFQEIEPSKYVSDHGDPIKVLAPKPSEDGVRDIFWGDGKGSK